MLNGMNENPKPRAAPSRGSLAAQYSQLLGMQQLGTELMASVTRTNALGESFARAQRTGNEVASSVLKSQKSGTELVANVIRAQGTGESFARTQRLGLEMVSNLASTQRLAGVFASAQAVATAHVSRSLPGVLGLGDLGVWAFTQALAVNMEPSPGMRWFNTAMQAGDVPQLAGVLPPMLRNWDLSSVFRPLLDAPSYRPLGDAGQDLAQWVAGRLTGSAAATPERFEEIAGSLESIELDEESAQRLARMAEDEPTVQAGLKWLGLQRFTPQSLNGLLALSAALGISVSILMVIGLIWAPLLTAIITGSIGTGTTVGVAAFKGGIIFSPGARAQLDAMKPTHPDAHTDEDDDGPEGT